MAAKSLFKDTFKGTVQTPFNITHPYVQLLPTQFEGMFVICPGRCMFKVGLCVNDMVENSCGIEFLNLALLTLS
jgi:hypothetical protein